MTRLHRYIGWPSLALSATLATTAAAANATHPITPNKTPEAIEGEYLVKFKQRVTTKNTAAHRALEQEGLEHVKHFKTVPGLQLMRASKGKGKKPDLAQLRLQGDIEFIEPNYRYQAQGTPANDVLFNNLWGLDNQGQTGGTMDIDINAPEAWDITQGSENVVVAVIDSGVDYTHPDLIANMWTNPGEIPNNGIDDDLNGVIDDVHGLNAILGTGNPMDDNDHGTHVAGTIGAAGNNGIGVTGVNWHTRIIACKFLDSEGSGSTADAIRCLDYLADLKQAGVNIIASNNSWGGGGYSQALAQAISNQQAAGILFIAAAGNESTNIDASPSYPAAYSHDNIISVAAIDHNGQLASFSNYGLANVDVAAPGVNIRSTIPGNQYASFNGTSMATPHVTGLVALTKAALPELDWRDLKNRTLAGARSLESLTGKMLTGSYVRAYDNDGFGAISCDRLSTALISPATSDVTLSSGSTLTLEAFISDCQGQGEPLPFYVNETYAGTLDDSGIAPDTSANDLRYTAAWTAPSPGDYEVSIGEQTIIVHVVEPYPSPEVVTDRYQTISGTPLTLTDDSLATINLPFNVTIGQQSLSQLQVGSNGCVGQLTGQSCHYSNQRLPGSGLSTTGSALAVLWDDWNPEQGGGVFYEIIGEAPQRQVVIEWRNLSLYGNPEATATFQAVLSENHDDIEFNYQSLPTTGLSATVGVQLGSSLATQYSFNNASPLYDGLSLLWHGFEGGMPSGLQSTIQTNQTEYVAGEQHTVEFSLVNEGEASVVDLYIWLELPNGGAYYYSATGLTQTPAPLRSALTLRNGFRLENRTIFDRPLPALRAGDYTWNIVTVAAGDELIEANWLSQDHAPFTVIASDM